MLEKGRVELRNFGVFQVKKRKARKARNPKTNAEVAVGERYIVTFKPGKLMEQRVAELTSLPQEGVEETDLPDDQDDAVDSAVETPRRTTPAPQPAPKPTKPPAGSDDDGSDLKLFRGEDSE